LAFEMPHGTLILGEAADAAAAFGFWDASNGVWELFFTRPSDKIASSAV